MVKEGQEIEAMVSFTTDRLVGLDIGGGVIINVDHRKTGISRTIPLSAVYQRDEVVSVSIQKVEENTGEIEILPVDPWKELHYVRGAVLSCTVVHLGEKNIFVSARPGVVGIAPYPVNGGEKPELGKRLVFQVNEFNPSEKSLSLRYYDPEIIRGRKKNRAYWKRQRDRKKEQADQAES
jgi:small subunit ribosomal protein S1